MTLGRGLESLIPPKNPFDKAQGEPFKKTQDDLGDVSQSENQQKQVEGEKTWPLGADTFRAEHLPAEAPPAGRAGLAEAGPAGSIEPSLPAGRQGQASLLAGETQRVEGEDFFRPSKEEEPTKQSVFQIETDKIAPNPHQPRRHFDEVALGELANSIREFGIIQPLIVSKVERETDRGWEVSYELVAGERRLLAAKSLGLATVPAIIRQVPVEHEKLELAVTENVQRTNLNPIELARAVAKLQEDFKLTQREIATRLGKSREVIANTLRLLSLPSNIQEAVAKGLISESQARLLLSVDDAAAQERIFQEILNNNLTTREVSLRVRQLKVGAPLGARVVDPDLLALKEELEAALGAPVELKREGEGGKLTINFYSKEELEGILAKLKQNGSQFL